MDQHFFCWVNPPLKTPPLTSWPARQEAEAVVCGVAGLCSCNMSVRPAPPRSAGGKWRNVLRPPPPAPVLQAPLRVLELEQSETYAVLHRVPSSGANSPSFGVNFTVNLSLLAPSPPLPRPLAGTWRQQYTW